MFVNANRGKRTVTLDLKQPGGVAEAKRLLASADVLVSNWRESVAGRLGLADDVLAAANEHLVRVYVSGFGTGGPLVDEAAFDTVIQARLGFTEMFGDGTTPAIDSSFAVDKSVAAMVCQAALAAIVERERTGIARRVDLAMYDAAAYFNFPDFMVNRTFLRHEPPSAKNMHPSAVRPLRTSDGWIVTIAGTREQTRRSLAVIGRLDVYPELMKIPDGVEITRRLYAELAEVLVTDTTEHWLAAFAAKDLATAPCLTIDEHLASEQTAHNGLYDIVDWQDERDFGPMRHVRYPAVFVGHPPLHPTSGIPPLHAAQESHE